MTDFSALDEAFDGATTPEKKPDRVSGTAEEVVRAGGESGERRIELSELRIEMTAQEGPRAFLFSSRRRGRMLMNLIGVGLSIRPLSPVHLSDSTDLDQNAPGTLTHLEWLEDLALPLNPAPGAGSEAAVDLRLLAVSARGALPSILLPRTKLTRCAHSFGEEWTAIDSCHLGTLERAVRAFGGVRGTRVQEVGRGDWRARMGESGRLDVLIAPLTIDVCRTQGEALLVRPTGW